MEILCKLLARSILKVLLEEERMYRGQISEVVNKKGSTFQDTLTKLEELGIIASEVEDKFGGKKWYWLTPEGKEIAKHLIEIEKIMERIGKKKGDNFK